MYVGIGILFLLYGYFRGINRPHISLVLTVISIGTRVALSYALAPHTALGVVAMGVQYRSDGSSRMLQDTFFIGSIIALPLTKSINFEKLKITLILLPAERSAGIFTAHITYLPRQIIALRIEQKQNANNIKENQVRSRDDPTIKMRFAGGGKR